ncbi:DUF6388 family protein [Pseudomonas sp. GM80]|uniref:DUF6388 family protein n=1 Tax=Pseudomonas sp. GM80 TaxID=1144339 RepID=UPI00026F4E0C|nr:DUF6388 family protein [Pseudomonas sp. GM80]EJN36335.1 hypothetical protein PMI37_00117 [Pseudomonas sp. GM80]
MELRNKIHQNAVGLIAKANPAVVREAENASEAELCGLSHEDYKNLRITNILTSKAKSLGITPWEYQLRLAEEIGMDVVSIRAEDERAEADALGLS